MLEGRRNDIMTINKRLQVLVIITHIAVSAAIFSPQEVFNSQTIYSGDYPLHLYRVYRSIESGGTAGYDPYHLAGYYFNQGQDVGARPMQLLARVFCFAPAHLVFKIYVFMALALVPFVLYQAAKDFKFSEREITVLLALGLLFTWRPILTYGLITHGVINYFFVSYLSLLLISKFYTFSSSQDHPDKLFLLLLAVSIVLIHVLSIMIVVLPLLIIFYYRFKQYSSAAFKFLVFVVGLTCIMNYPVIIEAGGVIGDYIQKDKAGRQTQYSEPAASQSDDYKKKIHLTETDLSDALSQSSYWFFLFPISAAGLYQLGKRKQKDLAFAFSFWVLFLFYLAFFGSFSSFFVKAQPLRFKATFMFAFIYPASIGLVTFFSNACIKLRLSAFEPKLFPIFNGVFLAAIVVIIFGFVSREDLSADLPKEGRLLIEWIKTQTNKDGRILLESSEGHNKNKNNKYFEGFFPALVPYLTEREFIGTTMFSSDRFAKFVDGVLFDKYVYKYKKKEIERLFELYNISYIIAWSDSSLEFFFSLPDFIKFEKRIGDFSVFKVNRNPTYFLKGDGKIQAQYNTLTLDNVRPVDGEIIIKYHWINSLELDGGGILQEEKVTRGSKGFIKVINPSSNFRIFYN